MHTNILVQELLNKSLENSLHLLYSAYDMWLTYVIIKDFKLLTVSRQTIYKVPYKIITKLTLQWAALVWAMRNKF